MRSESRDKEWTKYTIYLYIKTFLLGGLLAEAAFAFGPPVFQAFSSSSIAHLDVWLWLLLDAYIMMAIAYVKSPSGRKRVKFLAVSKRLDLLLLFAAGIAAVCLLDGIEVSYLDGWLKRLGALHWLLILYMPVVLSAGMLVRNTQLKWASPSDRPSRFMSDKEGGSKNDDEFGFAEKAADFAESVYNQGSPESLVFGVDAPWGTGKSTFINMCAEYWSEHYGDKLIVYKMDPLKFESSQDLLGKFVDGLADTIRAHFFAPELESLLAKYAQLLSDSKLSIAGFGGWRFGIPFDRPANLEATFRKLKSILAHLDAKIVIVVDDLDRLTFANVKEILYIIKKSFVLPNLSYVLCYDTDSIAAVEQQKPDAEKVMEFLEKFINIKISLYLDHQKLLDYFTQHKNETIAKNLLSNPEITSKAASGLKDIFDSADFHRYLPFVGDARKLKRLVNTIVLLDVTADANFDFNRHDLIHLLLIYIHYPNVFRKIYSTEMRGKRGFFSLLSNMDSGLPDELKSKMKDGDFGNSENYLDYVKDLPESPKFLLEKVFSAEQRIPKTKMLTNVEYTSYACFNGVRQQAKNRNLEKYLHLIVNSIKPSPYEQFQYYLNQKEEILNAKRLADVLEGEDFSIIAGKAKQPDLWRVLVNSDPSDFSKEKAEEVIQYAIDNLPRYSMLAVPQADVLLRDILIYYLIVLLDKVGWTDESGSHRNNSDENVLQIAEWMFGGNRHAGQGILSQLAVKERGVLGLHDLIIFRYYSCQVRDRSLYNLSTAMSTHGGPQNPTSGHVREIIIGQMREISQWIFYEFQLRYISRRINIFTEVAGLSTEALYGDAAVYVQSQDQADEWKKLVSGKKDQILATLLNDLGNGHSREIRIPCGYYDPEGLEDKQGIRKAISEYLFETCFDPQQQDNIGLECFMYFLILFSQGAYNIKRRVDAVDISAILNKNQLKSYWMDNKHKVRPQTIAFGFLQSEHGSPSVEHVEQICSALDQL